MITKLNYKNSDFGGNAIPHMMNVWNSIANIYYFKLCIYRMQCLKGAIVVKIEQNQEGNIGYVFLSEIWDYCEMSTIQCIEIIKTYIGESQLFFEGYHEYGGIRVDDNITKYRKLIPQYFKENGKFETRHYSKNKIISDSTKSAIGALPGSSNSYELIPFFCDYYLETLIFTPTVGFDWSKYVHYYSEHGIERKIEHFLTKGYTNIMFVKSDGGDFSIYFNINIYPASDVYKIAKKLINATTNLTREPCDHEPI